MTAARATWLTWKLHRFEVLVASALMVGVAGSAWVVRQHIDSLTIPMGCWDWAGDAYPSEMCQRLVNAFFDIVGNEGGHVRMGLLAVPTVVGLVLGATLVGRELELRTAALAWSLEGGRMRWLVQRLGAVVLLLCIGLAAMAWFGSGYDAAARNPRDMDRIGELAMRGVPLLTRGFAALAVALLTGALLGRTLPALLVAVVGAGALWYVGSGVVPTLVAPPFAVWIDDTQRREGAYVHVVEYAEFDTTRPGAPGEPGVRLASGERYAEGLRQVCGPAPRAGEDGSTYQRCSDEYDPSMVFGGWLAVPASALPVIEGAQAGLDLLVVGGSVAATAIIVRRRRPD